MYYEIYMKYVLLKFISIWNQSSPANSYIVMYIIEKINMHLF